MFIIEITRLSTAFLNGERNCAVLFYCAILATPLVKREVSFQDRNYLSRIPLTGFSKSFICVDITTRGILKQELLVAPLSCSSITLGLYLVRQRKMEVLNLVHVLFKI